MTKKEVVREVANRTRLTRDDAEVAVTAFLKVVEDVLVSGDKINLMGFGTFDITERGEREGRNPQTGESMTLSSSKCPKFKASKALKDLINGQVVD